MIYAIGDIHGERWKLERLLTKIRRELADVDRMVFLGDYIDRGPDSARVLDMLLEVREQRPDTIFLRGNHEQMMLLTRKWQDSNWQGGPDDPPPRYIMPMWLGEGGAQTMKSYDVRSDRPIGGHWWEEIPEAHWSFLSSTIMEYMTERFHLVHAGLLPPGFGWQADELQRDPRLWIRLTDIPFDELFDGRVVVFGHTPQRSGEPLVRSNMICVDTGATFGGSLSCVALDDMLPFDPSTVRVIQS